MSEEQEVVPVVPPTFTEEWDTGVWECFLDGKDVESIAYRLGISEALVRDTFQRLGLTKQSQWSEEDMLLCQQLHRAGMTRREIATVLRRTETSIKNKVSEMSTGKFQERLDVLRKVREKKEEAERERLAFRAALEESRRRIQQAIAPVPALAPVPIPAPAPVQKQEEEPAPEFPEGVGTRIPEDNPYHNAALVILDAIPEGVVGDRRAYMVHEHLEAHLANERAEILTRLRKMEGLPTRRTSYVEPEVAAQTSNGKGPGR